jgi:uncharacterized protein
MKEKSREIWRSVILYGSDIMRSDGLEQEKHYMQHGKVSVYQHSLSVAYMSLYLARKCRLSLDERSLVRGALLHDYFLYDWHVPAPEHNLHGFSHAGAALKNAKRDFEINRLEQDIIEKHMFPLNIRPPKYKESIIVCLADKLCATKETVMDRR